MGGWFFKKGTIVRDFSDYHDKAGECQYKRRHEKISARNRNDAWNRYKINKARRKTVYNSPWSRSRSTDKPSFNRRLVGYKHKKW